MSKVFIFKFGYVTPEGQTVQQGSKFSTGSDAHSLGVHGEVIPMFKLDGIVEECKDMQVSATDSSDNDELINELLAKIESLDAKNAEILDLLEVEKSKVAVLTTEISEWQAYAESSDAFITGLIAVIADPELVPEDTRTIQPAKLPEL